MCEAFENDMRSRGMDLGPSLPGMIQVAGSGRGIDQTLVSENDGTISKHEGGEFGVIPGARPPTNSARDVNPQEEHTGSEAGKERSKKNKKSRANQGGGGVEEAGPTVVDSANTKLVGKSGREDTGNSAGSQGTSA